MSWLETVNGWLALVPAEGWSWSAIALMVALFVLLPFARRSAYAAGQRASGQTTGTRRERLTFFGVIALFSVFWAITFTASARGLLAFGRDTMRWRDGWDWVVPLSLDGVAAAAAIQAFWMVMNRRAPDRAMVVVWSATATSALINFVHEARLLHGSALGGFYLGMMSVAGMLLLHNILDQFSEGTQWIKREAPAFKARWITLFPNTFCAFLAWRNYPPEEGTPATVRAAVDHLDAVREMKSKKRRQREPAPWHWRLLPWRHVADLNRTIADQRVTLVNATEQHATLTERFQSVAERAADAESEISRLTAELRTLRADREDLAGRVELVKAERTRDRAEADAEIERQAAAHAIEVAELRATIRALEAAQASVGIAATPTPAPTPDGPPADATAGDSDTDGDSPDRDAAILAALDREGATQASVAAQMGVTVRTVQRVVKRHREQRTNGHVPEFAGQP